MNFRHLLEITQMNGDLYQPTLQAPAFGRTKKDLD